MKRCHACGEEKPTSAFRPHPRTWDGLAGRCRPCEAAKRPCAPLPPELRRQRDREAERRYRERHPEKAAEKHARWRARYPEEAAERAHRSYRALKAKDPKRFNELTRLRQRRYYRADHAIERARRIAYKRLRRWLTRHPEVVVGMLVAYGRACLACGNPDPVPRCWDHVDPLTLGGANGVGNLQPVCRSCNSAKRLRSIDYRSDGGDAARAIEARALEPV